MSTSLPLNEIQGNILKPFARVHARYLLISFNDRPEQSRRAFRNVIHRYVVSAAQQAAITDDWRQMRGDRDEHGRTVGCFGISASGYRKLGLLGIAPADATMENSEFNLGFGSSAYSDWNPHKEQWAPEYQNSEIGAFLLLQDNSLQRLDQTVAGAKSLLSSAGFMVWHETGLRLSKDPAGRGAAFEHFGCRDDKSKGADPMSLFADNRPDSPSPGSAFGCYATFMKVEQHVERFREAAKNLAGLIDRSAEDVEELAVGRRKDGDPLPGVPTDAVTGELNFAGVPPTMCPHHAHVRIMNRRDGTDVDRIVRRGIPYGPELGPDGEEHRGILFLSLQRTLPDFTALMGRVQWSLDPLLSQSVDWSWRQPQDSSTGLWQNGRFGQAWGSADAPISFPMADLTTVRGGEFFFLPRLTFLEDFV